MFLWNENQGSRDRVFFNYSLKIYLTQDFPEYTAGKYAKINNSTLKIIIMDQGNTVLSSC